jgi:dipeptidyl aminopeptidase/acylaminoacyl peptidase
VIQLDESTDGAAADAETHGEMAAYEGSIDYLDARDLIDRNRVGIIGFSRTGMTVEYTLTHSKHHFAAASLADITDAGYFRYVALLNAPAFATDSEGLNGGTIPFGEGMGSWLKESPGFNLDKVTTPVWLEANSRTSLFFEWEWFAGLTRLGKAVELLYMPHADHVVVKPCDRLSSQQRNVDWFRFWLKGEEDSDPAKTQQYQRWHGLRKLQEQNQSSGHTN